MQRIAIFLFVLLLPVAFVCGSLPSSAATDDVATGSGYLEPAIVDGGIELPTVPTTHLHPAELRSGKFKGPVHGVRTYKVTGYRLIWPNHVGSRNVAVNPRRISTGKHHYQLEEVVEYDRSGRLVRREHYKNGIRDELTLVTFSPRGNRKEFLIVRDERIFGNYDAAGRSIVFLSYNVAPGGAWHIVSRRYNHYDAAGREIAWSDGESLGTSISEESHGSRQVNTEGQVIHEESNGNVRSGCGGHVIVDCKYEAQRILSYSETRSNKCVCKATWKYEKEQVVLHKERFAHSNRGDWHYYPDVEDYHYDLVGRLQEYDAFGWSYELFPVGASFIVEQNDPFVTKLNDPYLIVTPSFDGAPSMFLHDMPLEKRQGDPPLYLRKSYRYDQQGRLQSIASFDGKGLSCLQGHTFPGIGIFNRTPTLYAVIRYRYDAKGQPTWTMYDTAGEIVHDALAANATKISQNGTTTLTGLGIVSSEVMDRYGNWIYSDSYSANKPTFEVRKISYY